MGNFSNLFTPVHWVIWSKHFTKLSFDRADVSRKEESEAQGFEGSKNMNKFWPFNKSMAWELAVFHLIILIKISWG